MKKLIGVCLVVLLTACAGYFSTSFDRINRMGWTRSSLREIDSLWSWSMDEQRELAGCLYGRFNLNATAVYVVRVEPPLKEQSLTANSATVTCERKDDFIGIAHTHPSGQYYMSGADERTMEIGKFPLMVVICGPTCRTTYKNGSTTPLEEKR